MERPGVSSINIGALAKRSIFLSNLLHSSSSSWPLRILEPAISKVLDINLFANCTLSISREKNAIGTRASTAKFLARDKAKDVFPMAGLPARITKSDFCHPLVSSSRRVYPVGKPVRPSAFSEDFFKISIASFRTGDI